MILEKFTTFKLKNKIKNIDFDGHLIGVEVNVIAELLGVVLHQWKDFDIEDGVLYLERNLGKIISIAAKEDNFPPTSQWREIINTDRKALSIVLDNIYKIEP